MRKEQQPAVKKVPQRLCIGCGALKPKKSLLRIVREANGEISLDASGRKNGRGAYICPDQACFAKIKKSRALDRSFKTGVDRGVYDGLIQEFLEGNPPAGIRTDRDKGKNLTNGAGGFLEG